MRYIYPSLLFFALYFIFPLTAFAEDDYIQCVEDNRRIICTLYISNYIQNTQKILTNGWENTLQIDIDLMDNQQTVILQKSRLEATQRCYLDPFEAPCLILWRGASSWQRYRDESAFLHAISKIGIQALTLSELPADNYIIRATLQIMGSAQKRIESIRNWFKQSNDPKGFSSGNSTLIGAFIGSKAENTESNVQKITLSTTPFYIDLDMNNDDIHNNDTTSESHDDANTQDI